MPERARIANQRTYENSWTADIEKWVKRQIRDNKWRFDSSFDFDDIMQEAKMLFCTLIDYYPIASENRHFFALFKTSLLRSFHDRANKQQRTITADVSVEETGDMFAGNMPNYGYLSVLLDEMPDELKLVLEALTSGRVRLKLNKTSRSFRHRENHNMQLRRKLALELVDPVGDLKRYLR